MTKTKKTLLIVDVQEDFCKGGALAVKGADEIIPIINDLINSYDLVIASKDWHAPCRAGETKHFTDFPPHCMRGSRGAEFHNDLNISKIKGIFYKGMSIDSDGFSAFDGTGLETYLNEMGVVDLDIVGLATDYCVKATALDAVEKGFRVTIISKACRAVTQKGKIRAESEMWGSGIEIK